MSTVIQCPGKEADAVHVEACDADSQRVVVQARPGWSLVDFGELWSHRELGFFLIWREVKVRYKQTVLGAAWAVLQPFLTMLVFSLLFRRVANVGSGIAHYSLFAFTGLVPWLFISQAVTQGVNSIVANQSLVSKTYLPRLLVPWSVVGAAFFDFAVASSMVVLMMAYFQSWPGLSVAILPLALLGLVIAALGFATMLSALAVAYRDLRYIVPFCVQLWLFCTPSIYMQPLEGRLSYFLPLNPAYGLILNFRAALLGTAPDAYSLTVSLAVALTLLIAGCFYFRRVEQTFADII